MHILFKKLRYKNFLSTGNQWTEIDLNKNRFTLIVGPNGSGKSTILDAICFALFNRAFRNINKPQLVNTINQKDCVVECEIFINGHDIRIVRGLKPAIFEIYIDGKLETKNTDLKDDQLAFEKYILKINFKSFCQVCVLGTAIFAPFMSLPKGERRKIIEDLLDLEIFTTMNIILKSKMDDCDNHIYELEHSKKINEDKLKIYQDHLQKIQLNIEKSVSEKEEKIISLEKYILETNNAIKQLDEEISSLSKIVQDNDQVVRRINELQSLQSQLVQKRKQSEKDITFLKGNVSCPTCNQNIDEDFKYQKIEEKSTKVNEINEALEKLNAELIKTNIVLKNNNKYLTEMNRKQSDIRILENKNDIFRENIVTIRNEIEKIKNNDDQDTTLKFNETKTILDIINGNLKTHLDKRVIMGYAAVMLKDGGIKAQIIKSYIPIINSLLAKYSAALDFFVEFQLNELFEETIKSRFRDEFSYESFSQGEKLRLDLAILFTWRAIAKMRNSIDTNLLVFDEILDGSMDVDGVDDLIKLLYSLTNNENVMIISHKDVFIDKFTNILRFRKEKNFSTVDKQG